MKKLITAVLILSSAGLSGQDTGLITDPRDGQDYLTVRIGDQWWTAENMNFYIEGCSWYYGNDSVLCHHLGRLYTFKAALEACPSGWHLPSDDEWKELEMHIGLSREEADGYNLRGSDEGGLLKSEGTDTWDPPNQDAVNSTGFSAPGGGYRNPEGGFGRIRQGASFWTSTAGDQEMAWFRSLHYDRGDIHRGFYKASYAYSVRCVKDTDKP